MSTPKVSAPVVGFNHNVAYGSRKYHVQTEDSGLPHAHYITHLFVGGNIVASTKTSYADKATEPDLPKLVRALMEAQHKSMLKRLVAGEFNELAERLSATHYEPGVLATGQVGPGAVNTEASAPIAAARLTPDVVQKVKPPAPPQAVPPLPVPPQPVPPQAAPSLPSPVQRPAPKPLPPVLNPAAAAKPAAPWQPAPPTASPPTPQRQPGAPLPTTTRVPPTVRPVVPPRLAPSTSAPRLAPNPPSPPPMVRKSTPTPKPAPSFFADESRPVEAPHDDLPTLFAEELVSEKSLDEVILAFLSADLETNK